MNRGTHPTRARVILMVAAAATLATATFGRVTAQDRARIGTVLPGGAVFLDLDEVPRVLSTLWACPAMRDEFEQQRCESTLRDDRAYAQRSVFVAATAARVGRYDFARHRFPVDVMGAVFNRADPEWLERRVGDVREPWRVESSDGPLMLVGPSQLRTTRDGSLQADWMRATQTFVEFDDDESAERWRNALPPSTDGTTFLSAALIFRVVRTFTVHDPPTAMERLVRQSMRRQFRSLALPVPPARGEAYGGVQVRILGWFVLGRARDLSRENIVLASGVTARGRDDRRVAQAVVDTMQRRSSPEAAPVVVPPSDVADANAIPVGREGAAAFVEVGSPGAYSADSVRTTFDGARTQLDACWPVLPATVTLDRLSVAIDVDGSGAVTGVAVSPSEPTSVVTCIEQEVRRLGFARTVDGSSTVVLAHLLRPR